AIREIEKNNEKKVWTTIGSLLVKLPREKSLELLRKDQIQIDTEINKLRSDQKVLVNKHRDLEHKTAYPGTHLKAMSHDEMSALKRNLPLGTS
uniref:P53 and DNA damage-regulated protein 1 n=1 Tax=Megaselia scalaris TaxID=36166 RepID=T1H7C4_MEGSC